MKDELSGRRIKVGLESRNDSKAEGEKSSACFKQLKKNQNKNGRERWEYFQVVVSVQVSK